MDPDVACPIEAVCMGLSTNIFSLLVKREALWRKTLVSTRSHPEQRQAALSHLQTKKVAVVIGQAWGGLTFPVTGDTYTRMERARDSGFLYWRRETTRG